MKLFAACGLVVATMLALSPGSAQAQASGFDPSTGRYDVDAPERRGQAGMSWMQIGGSARVEGMGSSAIGLHHDPSIVFYNPAGAATIRGIAVYANNTRWPGDVRVNHFAALTRVGPVTVGANFHSMDFGTFIGTIIDPTDPRGYREIGASPLPTEGELAFAPESAGISAWVGGITIASQITDRFSAGINLKYAVEDFDPTHVYSFVTGQRGYIERSNDNRASTGVIDIGTQYNTGVRNLAINMSFRNLAPTVNYIVQDFDLPLTYQVGFSFDAVEIVTGVPSDWYAVHTEISGVDRRDVPLDFAYGVEFVIRPLGAGNGPELALRTGRRPARNQDGWLSFGGGVAGEFSGVKAGIDYSYNDYGELFDAHRLSLTVFLNQ